MGSASGAPRITGTAETEQGKAGMARIFIAVLVLAILAVAALAVFAYFGDLTPQQAPVTVPVTLDVN